MLTLPLVSSKPLLKRKVASTSSPVPLTFDKKEQDERGNQSSLQGKPCDHTDRSTQTCVLYLWEERIERQSVDPYDLIDLDQLRKEMCSVVICT